MVWSAFQVLGLPVGAGAKEIARVIAALDAGVEAETLCRRMEQQQVSGEDFLARSAELVFKSLAVNIVNNETRRKDHEQIVGELSKERADEHKPKRKAETTKRKDAKEEPAAASAVALRNLELKALDQFHRDAWSEFFVLKTKLPPNLQWVWREEMLYPRLCEDFETYASPPETPTWLTGEWQLTPEDWLQRRRDGALLVAPVIMPSDDELPIVEPRKKSRKKNSEPQDAEPMELLVSLLVRAIASGEFMIFKELMEIDEFSRLEEWTRILQELPRLEELETAITDRVRALAPELKKHGRELLDVLAEHACRLGKIADAARSWELLGVRHIRSILLRDCGYQALAGKDYASAARFFAAAGDLETGDLTGAPGRERLGNGALYQDMGVQLHFECVFNNRQCFTLEDDARLAPQAVALLLGSERWLVRFEGLAVAELQALLQELATIKDPQFGEFLAVFMPAAQKHRELVQSYDLENPGLRDFPRELLAFQNALSQEMSDMFLSNPPKEKKDQVRADEENSLLPPGDEAEIQKELQFSVFQILGSIGWKHPLALLMVCIGKFRDHWFLVPTRETPGFPVSVPMAAAAVVEELERP